MSRAEWSVELHFARTCFAKRKKKNIRTQKSFVLSWKTSREKETRPAHERINRQRSASIVVQDMPLTRRGQSDFVFRKDDEARSTQTDNRDSRATLTRDYPEVVLHQSGTIN